MGIEPNDEGLGSVRLGRYSSGLVRVRPFLSSGSVRFDQLHSSGSVRVRLMRVSQLRIWFGHSGNCMKLGALEKSNTCNKTPKQSDRQCHAPIIRHVTVHSSKFQN